MRNFIFFVFISFVSCRNPNGTTKANVRFINDHQNGKEKINNRPIIGIMSEEIYEEKGKAYIASSYVKFLQSGGARVVPIRLGEDQVYYKKMFNSINGLLFPGGGLNLITSHYAKASKIMFELAIQANKRGDYFPIIGICLGFEMLSEFLLGTDILDRCSEEDVALPLQFNTKSAETRLFKELSPELFKIFTTEHVAVNYHHKCFFYKTFKKGPYNKIARVLTTSNTSDGERFISTIEAVHYPFYGLQWHPEKSVYIWIKRPGLENIPHTRNAIRAAQYIANFFVQQARMSLHRFSSPEEESDSLIYNYEVIYMGKIKKSIFEQIYIIPGNFSMENELEVDEDTNDVEE